MLRYPATAITVAPSDVNHMNCPYNGNLCIIHDFFPFSVYGSAAGYKYSPKTRKFYKYVQANSKIAYADAITTCTNDNANAVIAPPIEPDIIWLLNITAT